MLNGQKDIFTKNGKEKTVFVKYFFLHEGYAARPNQDGVNVLSFLTNVANVSIEVLERDAPMKGLTKFYLGEELILNLPGGEGYGLKEERDNKLIARDNELGYNN